MTASSIPVLTRATKPHQALKMFRIQSHIHLYWIWFVSGLTPAKLSWLFGDGTWWHSLSGLSENYNFQTNKNPWKIINLLFGQHLIVFRLVAQIVAITPETRTFSYIFDITLLWSEKYTVITTRCLLIDFLGVFNVSFLVFALFSSFIFLFYFLHFFTVFHNYQTKPVLTLAAFGPV